MTVYVGKRKTVIDNTTPDTTTREEAGAVEDGNKSATESGEGSEPDA